MLLDTYKRDNIRLAGFFGVEYPAWFVNPAAEYQALARNAGAIDLTHCSLWQVSGADRVSFLDAMLTNDVGSLETDRGCHALLTTIKGKIIAELFVHLRRDDVIVQVSQGDAAEALGVLQKHVVMEDVTITDVSDQFAVLALEGAKAEDIMWRLFEKGPFPKDMLHGVERRFGDIDVYVTRNSVTGEAGYHMMMPSKTVGRMWDFLVQGARGSDGLPVGGIAWNMRRIENGLPWYGVDFDADNFPDECRLGHAVSYTKGCFRGQETLGRLHHRGHVNRVLVGMVPEETPSALKPLRCLFAAEINNYDEAGLKKEAPAVSEKLDFSATYTPGSELRPADGGDKAVGQVTGVAYSPLLHSPLIMGYVRLEIAEARGSVSLNGTPLRVVELPAATPA